MSKEIIRQLKSLKHADTGPSEEWLKNNRKLLLSQISNSSAPKHNIKFNFENAWQAMSVFLPHAVVYNVVRPAMVMVLVLMMGVGSWVATVSASYESLPGDWLYPAKRVAEKTQVAVADVVGNKNEVVKLHGEFALRRAIETRDIVSQNNPDKLQIASEKVDALKEEMNTVNNKLEEIKTTLDSGSEVVKNINQNAQEITDVLKAVKVNLLISTDDVGASDLSSQVSEVKNMVKDTAVKAVEVMVEKHLQGDVSVSKDDVKQAISDQLDSAIKDAAESKQSMVDVNKAIDVVKTEVSAIALDNKNNDQPNTTQALSDKVEETSKQTQAAVDSSQQFNTETGKTVNEGQQFLSQDNLAQAMDKVKEANAVNAQAEKITDDTLKAVQNILPVVAVAAEGAVVVVVSSTPVITSSTLNTTSLNKIINVSTTVKSSVSTTIKVNVSTTPAIVPKTTTTIRQ